MLAHVNTRAFIVGTTACGALLAAREASACGAAYPGGPMVCTLADAPSRKAQQKVDVHARVSASWAYTSTTILFSGDRRADLTRHTVFAGTELPLTRGLGLRFGAGGIVAGELDRRGPGVATLGPGVSGYFGVAKTLLDEATSVPFVQLAATLSASRAVARRGVESEGFTAFDVRAAATVGKTFFRETLPVVPYVALRAFGGPIFYRFAGADVTGTDLYKYQVGAGLSLALPGRALDAFVEGVALGERGLSAGLGTTF